MSPKGDPFDFRIRGLKPTATYMSLRWSWFHLLLFGSVVFAKNLCGLCVKMKA